MIQVKVGTHLCFDHVGLEVDASERRVASKGFEKVSDANVCDVILRHPQRLQNAPLEGFGKGLAPAVFDRIAADVERPADRRGSV